MSKEIELEYFVDFGGDYSDTIPFDATLTDKEAALYEEAIRLRRDPNEVAGLQHALARAYREIERIEIESYLDTEDEYVMKCLGYQPIDEMRLWKLISERDPHTLKYFGLTKLSDDGLAKWNPEDLPPVCEIDASFEPVSPFDEDWRLEVRFINEKADTPLPEQEARSILKELFQRAMNRKKRKFAEIRDFIAQQRSAYEPDEGDGSVSSLSELAEMIARNMGMADYQA